MRYSHEEFPYRTPGPLAGRPDPRHEAVIVGAGPIGLALAVDLALRGVRSVVLDDNNTVSVGSRAICWAKRTLEIFDRLGVGERMIGKGVTWRVGRTHHREDEIFSFDLLPEDGHKAPAFINLPQYYVEQYLAERCADFPDLIDLRFRNRVTAVEQGEGFAAATVETPDGAYRIEADYLVACDGAKSPVRAMLGLEFAGELFEERFLIADIVMEADFPPERRFWFEPTFHPGQSALLHKQPDDLYRIDLQLGWDADPKMEKRPERVIPRIEKVVGGRPFTLDWVSVYSFQCRRLAHFVHDRVIFAGDSAHVVSPFGARGGNGGVQDIDNLGWKLAASLARPEAAPALLASYDDERAAAADENIRASARSTRFMSPGSSVERLFRDSVLALARHAPFARAMVDSGRLSTPCAYAASALNGPDDDALPPGAAPGRPCQDAPVGAGWLLDALGTGFTLVGINMTPPDIEGAAALRLDEPGHLAARYLGDAPAALYLVRPDTHIAARWAGAAPEQSAIETALRTARGET